VHLHVHSPFSFLDGGSSIENLISRAAQLQMPAIAITDHNTLSGAVKFNKAARQAGIKAIVGTEITTQDGSHLTLLARNSRGYSSLCRLLSAAHLSNPRHEPQTEWNELKNIDNVIVLSGCRRGEISALILNNQIDAAYQRVLYYHKIFGQENFYIELQDTLLPGNRRLNHYLLQIAQQTGVEAVAANNVHYACHEDFIIHDLLTCVRIMGKVSDIHPQRPLNGENYLKSAQQMQELFSFYPRAVQNTLRISEQCEPVLNDQQLHFPGWENSDQDPAALLRKITFDGAYQRYGRISRAVRERLDYELSIIIQMGFASYFLLVWDLVRYARSQGIRYAGRGSAADSLVSYCLFICEVDALERGLLFERFMSPERSQLPDIDIDFEARCRDKVIDYIYKKYGSERVARVATYNTFMARSAIRDIGKALDMDPEEIGAIAKQLPHAYADSIRHIISRLPELRNSPLHQERFKLLLDVCENIAGFPRFLGTHLGGVVISDCPLQMLTPLQRSALGPVICQFDKDDVEELGLVKLDLLSLRTLSAVSDACSYINRNNQEFDYDSIPANDPATYNMIAHGETIGVFQLESPAQRALQMQLGASQMEDIIASVALIRPGPIKGNMVEPYIKRRQGAEPVTYLHPRLEPILKKTYGVVLFQEQVIEIATSIAGFTPGEADQLRRVMTHARSRQLMEEIGRNFVQKSIQNGIEQQVAEEIFNCMVGYASYGFCEAHAAAFANTSYKTAYLAQHYPAEYFAAILNHQPMGYYPPNIICTEARRRGVTIRGVDVNKSDVFFKVEETDCIRVGFKQVKGLDRQVQTAIVESRLECGPFECLLDFVKRTKVEIDMLENLIKCGALDTLNSNRRQALTAVPDLLAASSLSHESSIFATDIITYLNIADVSDWQKTYWERSILGLDVGPHFMARLRDKLNRLKILSSRQIAQAKDGAAVQVSGLLFRPHRPPTRSGKITVFLSLEDEFGLTDVTMFENVYMKYGQYIFAPQQGPLLIKGRVNKRGQGTTVIAQQIDFLEGF